MKLHTSLSDNSTIQSCTYISTKFPNEHETVAYTRRNSTYSYEYKEKGRRLITSSLTSSPSSSSSPPPMTYYRNARMLTWQYNIKPQAKCFAAHPTRPTFNRQPVRIVDDFKQPKRRRDGGENLPRTNLLSNHCFKLFCVAP